MIMQAEKEMEEFTRYLYYGKVGKVKGFAKKSKTGLKVEIHMG